MKYFEKIAIAPLALVAGGALASAAVTAKAFWEVGAYDAQKDKKKGKATYLKGAFKPKSFVLGDVYRYGYMNQVRKDRKKAK